MGAGLALHFSKAISRLDRQESETVLLPLCTEVERSDQQSCPTLEAGHPIARISLSRNLPRKITTMASLVVHVMFSAKVCRTASR